MPINLRKFFLSIPVITVIGLFTLYLVAGFFALPAIMKWQIEKQVPEKLGQRISVGDIRFNPLVFKFEVNDLALSDSDGGPMLGFKRLQFDFELRSAIERAWTFAHATLDAPVLHIELGKDGRHNFAALLQRLRTDEEAGAPPRFIVDRVLISGGRVEYSDRLLAEPAVARIEPVLIEIDHLSSLPDQVARYRLSARTAEGETLDASGDLALNRFASKGKLTLNGVKLATLARGLSRFAALEAPAGNIDFAANFDLGLDGSGQVSGKVQDIDLNVAALSFAAAGAAEPLMAVETLALKQGRIDLGGREAKFAQFRLAQGRVAAAIDAQGRLDWARLARAAAPDPLQTAVPAAPTAPAPHWRVSVASADIAQIALRFADARAGRRAQIAAIGLSTAASAEFAPAGTRVALEQPQLSLSGARLAHGADTLEVPSAVIQAGRVALNPADAAISGAIEDAKIALAGASFVGSAQSGQLSEVSLEGKHIALKAGSERLELGIDGLRGALAALQAKLSADGVDLRDARLSGEKLTLAQDGERLRIAGGAAAISVSRLVARQGPDRISLRDAALEAKSMSASAGGGSTDPIPVDARFEGATLRLATAGIVAKGGSTEFGQVARARFGAKTLTLALRDGPADVRGEGLNATLADVVVRNPVNARQLLRLGRATLSGGVLHLKDRVASADRLALADGIGQISLDAQGKFNWQSLLRRTAVKPAPAARTKPAGTAAAWRVALKSGAVDGFAVGVEDQRVSPGLVLGLKAIRARIAGFDTASTKPAQVELHAALESGGQIDASGAVRADNGMSDVKITMAGIALAPVQSYLSQFAELRLASGTMSADGRLRYNDAAGAGAKLAYAGKVSIDRLLLEEVEPKRPFLAWDSVASNDVLLTLQPNRADIGELRIERPSGRLIIAADHTVNLTDVLKKPKAQKDAGSAPAQEGEAGKDPFPLSIARIRIAGGALEFADLSLRPQFATRMHDLKGVITGLATDPKRSAKLQLDAQVDKHGSARIRGQMSVVHPGKFTEIDMAFRNLELVSLSPYIAKFAGYRIAGGRLALDLQYRVENAKLVGENKIVLNQVELGEKVESPDALDLPLELALAILKDSNGVIDIGLPVSGDLSDPKFDYGAIIGKAVGNLLGGIVTAPFRALGALFGGSGKNLDTIDFEPGSDAIAPPERQKLEAIARALTERPALMLVVPPTSAAAADAPALKSLAVRTDILGRMGVKLTPGEDPGPIDTANPRVQRAVEAALSQRYAPEVLAALKQRALEAAAPAAQQQPGPPAAFHQLLVKRMIEEEPLPAQALAQLAMRRGVAIVHELTTVAGVPATRVTLGAPRQAADTNDKAVTLQLQLEVAK